MSSTTGKKGLDIRFRRVEEDFTYTPKTQGLGSRGYFRLIGTAGSGVTTTIIDSVCARIDEGVAPNNIVVVGGSKKSVNRINDAITAYLLATNPEYSAERSIARTMHSLAYEILVYRARKANQEFLPRLLSGAEQDAIIRELLLGQAKDAEAGEASMWPEDIRPAITLVSFARELRDFLLRAIERGYAPEELIADGEKWNRPRWVAAGKFLKQYEEIMGLEGAERVSGSELIVKANEALADPDILADWQNRVKYLYIDDAQNLDPLSAKLLETLIPATTSTIIAGDPDQSVFHFRGASGEFLRAFKPPFDQPIEELRYEESLRKPEECHALIASSPMEQYRFIADRVRRAHLLDGVPYSNMAIVTRNRSPFGMLRHVLHQANVPVKIPATEIVLNEEPLVQSLLITAKSFFERLTSKDLQTLLTGPIIGADAVLYNRLIRSVRQLMIQMDYELPPDSSSVNNQALDVLRNIFDPFHKNTEAENEIREALVNGNARSFERIVFNNVEGLIQAGYKSMKKKEGVELIFWNMWDSTGLSRRLQNIALGGGTAGAQASHELDVAMTFFDYLGDFAERNPGAELRRFISAVEEQQLPTITRERGGFTIDAVNLLTAHSTQGQEWSHVFIAQVNAETWPNLDRVGTLFGLEEFLDYVDNGMEPGTPNPHLLARLSEEKRLFNLACGRATDALYILAVDEPSGDDPVEPSMYLDQMAKKFGQKDNKAMSLEDFFKDQAADSPELEADADAETPALDYRSRMRVYSREELIAELRRVVCNIGVDPYSELARSDARKQAAAQLNRLIEAEVPGSNPEKWVGMIPLSSHTSVESVRTRRVGPSNLSELFRCPLSFVVRNLGQFTSNEHSRMGTLVHAYAEAVIRGLDREEARTMVLNGFERAESQLTQFGKRADFEKALGFVDKYIDSNPAERRFPELNLDVMMGEGDDAFRVAGRIDLLELRSNESRIVDFKYSSKKPEEFKLQLWAYAVAARAGLFDEASRRITDAAQLEQSPSAADAVELQNVVPAVVGFKTTTKAYAEKTLPLDGDDSQESINLEEFINDISESLSALRLEEVPACGDSTCATCTSFGLATDGDESNSEAN
ncbi:MAG: ATP-dependent DNA helicase [Corynebacterium sp.]|nr:ATP-dependent DNA helicase [Corynebacterium sp.]